jgi:hypothetical protein
MTSSRKLSTPAEELIYSNEKDLLKANEAAKFSTGVLSAEEFADVAAVYKLLSKWRDEDKKSKIEAAVRQNDEGPNV